ncbi:uncharacterized protein LOC9654870 [Selaginella moellendorffii]|uniref:uncharacterized protein LOC9654870 n=1 Tax=Selaginella moellendorffii TaxID=88036 RepID=UPI000D1CC1DC|nr:uncharacterized protein LOC9654870 [Selaginella moellendorffii]|eukprot:XP_024525029.1 uncharacterized protein LOC9654870 [Selaginella moellendorffii]
MGSPALFLLLVIAAIGACDGYFLGEYVPLARRGQYHNMRTPWHDYLGRHCPRFGINREVVVPIPKPVGYSGADPYKISLQFGHERITTPWLFIVGRQSSKMPMIDVTLRYTGGDLEGVSAKVVEMPEDYVAEHEGTFKEFWDPSQWPKHVLVRYNWEEKSEIDVATGFYILFGSAFLLTLVMSIYILQSSKDKLSRFVRENVIDTGITMEELQKAE